MMRASSTPVIETFLHIPGNNHDNDAKTAQLV